MHGQAIKSSASQRWRTLLGFPCRNRLLLTGTPIQNSMVKNYMYKFDYNIYIYSIIIYIYIYIL